MRKSPSWLLVGSIVVELLRLLKLRGRLAGCPQELVVDVAGLSLPPLLPVSLLTAATSSLLPSLTVYSLRFHMHPRRWCPLDSSD